MIILREKKPNILLLPTISQDYRHVRQQLISLTLHSHANNQLVAVVIFKNTLEPVSQRETRLSPSTDRQTDRQQQHRSGLKSHDAAGAAAAAASFDATATVSSTSYVAPKHRTTRCGCCPSCHFTQISTL